MKSGLLFPKIAVLTVIAGCFFLLSAGVVTSETAPRATEVDVLRFDAILELIAPLAGTHVTLCARYWVSPKHYRLGVVWAEPGEGALNFPTYPPTLQIYSNEQEFSLTNQFLQGNEATFSKPLGQRGVFRYKFNNYPVANIRFAESEALASRVYVHDLEKMLLQGADAWHTVDLARGAGQNQSDRDATKLDARVSDGRIVALKLMDPNGHLTKSIDYAYARDQGRSILLRQNVLLSERMLTVGYNKGGAKVKIRNKEQTFKELPGSHHKGGRRCTIEYQRIKMGDRMVALPTCITVRHAETNAVLRTARLSNFVQLKQTPEEIQQTALDFSRFADNEIKLRELFNKYWQEDPLKIEDADAMLLKRLRAHFESLDVNGKTLSEQLKRINMLMQLDWIQAHDTLSEHFQQYLHILALNDLNQMVLLGGLEVIGTTIQWGQFHTADKLLRQWIESVIETCDVESILTFAQIQMKRRHYWTISRLLEECSKSSQGSAEQGFDIQALISISLWELYQIAKDSSNASTRRAIAQADFASWSLSYNGLLRAATEGLAEAKQLFVNLDKPTTKQRTLKRQLDRIDAKLRATADK